MATQTIIITPIEPSTPPPIGKIPTWAIGLGVGLSALLLIGVAAAASKNTSNQK